MATKDQLQQVKILIQNKRYAAARAMLKEIDHPIAQQWLAKLDEIAPEKPPEPLQPVQTQTQRPSQRQQQNWRSSSSVSAIPVQTLLVYSGLALALLAITVLIVRLIMAQTPVNVAVLNNRVCDHPQVNVWGTINTLDVSICITTRGQQTCSMQLVGDYQNAASAPEGFSRGTVMLRIPVGRGNNTMNLIPRDYQLSDIHIRATDGTRVIPYESRVLITGSTAGGGGRCTVYARVIEIID